MSDTRRLIERTLIPHTAYEIAMERLEQCFPHAEDASEPTYLSILGESRTGKSRVLEAFSAKHPSMRSKTEEIVPVLLASVPARPTANKLAEVMLAAIGDKQPTVGTENQKKYRLQRLLKSSRTRVVMIDEFQHIQEYRSEVIRTDICNWLKLLIDDCNAVLVIAGLPSCQSIIQNDPQWRGRFSSTVNMPRYDWSNEDLRDEFIAILDGFDQALSGHFDIPKLADDALAFRVYCATGGLVGYLTKFLRQVVWNAVDTNAQAVTLEDLAAAYTTATWTMDGVAGLPNPFLRNFSTEPTSALLAAVLNVGIKPFDVTAGTTRRRAATTNSYQQTI